MIMTAKNVIYLFLTIICLPYMTAAAQAENSAQTSSQAALSATTDRIPNLFIIGDSTASNGADLGWGSHLGTYFDSSKINVINRARAGRSSRTFLTEGLWDQELRELQPGDYVLIQFGHNDGGLINDRSRARGSLKGVGEETQEIDNLQTGKHEVVHTFGWYMRKFINDTKAKNATPIVRSEIYGKTARSNAAQAITVNGRLKLPKQKISRLSM